jgi:hypothetical protein
VSRTATDVPPDLISRVTDAVLDEVGEWQNRPLDAGFRFGATPAAWHSPLCSKQGKLSMSPTRFVERIDLATPRFALANRTPHRTTTCAQRRRPSNPAAPSPTWLPGRNPIHLS